MCTFQVEGYSIVERLGSGSYSTVYKAFRKNGPREVVAIKCVEKSKLSGSAVDNIVTEITLLKVLKHEYIVEMKDFHWDDRYIYIIMEYCDAGDLSRFIQKRRKLPEVVCKKFLQQLAMALKFLRAHDVCHMDLKPQNLLLMSSPQMTLKVADFGLSQFLSPDDSHSSMRGSPLYMAPEILLKHKYDYRVDLWSVGVIMYECLFGKAPYSSSNFKELAEKIKSQKKIDLPPGAFISPECRDLLTRLLQHDPNQRISYEDFFQHPFLDLEHMPSPESYEKAIQIVTAAVKFDADKQLPEAFNQYCEALRYFIPLINAEQDDSKKAALRNKVNEYIKRAEDLKHQIYEKDKPQAQELAEVPTMNELRQMCSRTPDLVTALEIGHAAELYLAEGQYHIALEKFQACLGVMVPLLGREPRGRRRDMLHQQVQHWMKQAENIKAVLTLVDLSNVAVPENKVLYLVSSLFKNKEW